MDTCQSTSRKAKMRGSIMRENNQKTVKNTAMQKHGVLFLDTALRAVGWIAFFFGIYVVIDPALTLILLAVSRVLP